jgi:diketogulonate reductase-like aldo/keto reductase
MIPSWLYGTAWKEDATESLVYGALVSGFRGLDTANQRKHYYEEGCGRGLARAIAEGKVRRDELFIQSKFTFRDGQDARLPYDEHAAVATQVAQSYASSLVHLGIAKLDSLVLHGPSQREGLGAADREAWRAMEALGVANLGISNCSAPQIEELVAFAKQKPAFVQNRCYASRGWDREVREACAKFGIVYQGFSLLTANREVVAGAAVGALVRRHGKTREQIIFRFAQQLGMLPLTGTSSPKHMREDLAIADFVLAPEDLTALGG